MKFNSFLMVAAAAATMAQASAFEWQPVSLYPNASQDIQVVDFMGNVSFNCYVEGVQITDVMPMWIDEDGNEIKATSGEQPFEFDLSYLTYTFDVSDIKANGEYTLLFPEGMLLNAAGEKSDKVETYYTLADSGLAPAMFDDFEVISVTPELSQPQAIWNDQIVTVNTNHNDAIGVTTLQITDTTIGEVVVSSSNFASNRPMGDSAPISWEVANTYSFYEGHIYRAEFTFYNGVNEFDPETGVPAKVVAKATFDFTGRVEAYKYSDIELLDVVPMPGEFLISEPSQAVFTFTFSGPVTITRAWTPRGQNDPIEYPASCLSSSDDNTVWTLNLSDNDYVRTVDAMLTICISVQDMDGFQLPGNFGEEALARYEMDWDCELGCLPIVAVTPEQGASIDRLSEVVVKAVNGQPMAWSWNGEATVKNNLGEVLGMLVYTEGDGEADASLSEIRFTKWMDDNWNVTDIDLVKEGRYYIEFGPGCFVFGEQFEEARSRSLNSAFTVTGALDQPDPVVDPAEQEVFFFEKAMPANNAIVTSIEKIQLWYPDMVACEEFFPEVYDTADNSLVATGFGLYDPEDLNLINIDFAQPVVKAGLYEVVIPARVIYDDAFATSDGKQGICNPEIRLYYIVDPTGLSVESVDAADADAVYYDLTGRRVLNPSKGIYIVGGKKVVK